MIVFPWAEFPELVAAPLAAAAELVLRLSQWPSLSSTSCRQRRHYPTGGVAAATAASNLFLVGISIETFRYVA